MRPSLDCSLLTKHHSGKRAEVTDGSGLKVTAGEDDVLVRKPREEDKEMEEELGMNPWQFLNLESQLRRM